MIKKIVQISALVASLPLGAVAVAQALRMQAGEWETVTTTTAVDVPGAPPAVANAARGRSMTIRHCITPQEVAQGPQVATKTNKACTVTFHAGLGGRFTSDMVCKQAGGTINAASSGVMGVTSFSSTTKMMMTGAQAMTITSTATGHRIGDCKG